MSANGLDVFDKTLQTTHIWLDEIMDEIGPDRQVAWHVLGAVLRALRDRLPLELAAHLGAQLPLLVRGLYYDQFRPRGQPERSRALDDFLARIGQDLATTRPLDPRAATRAVLQVLSHHVNRAQVDKARHALPNEIRALWPDHPDAPDRRERPEQYRAGSDAGAGQPAHR